MANGERIEDDDGQRSRANKLEKEERTYVCRSLLAQGKRDGEIKRALAAKYHISPRTVERYIRAARDEILAETKRSREEHRADSLAFYQSVVADKTAKTQDRLRARENIDDLLGLPVPKQLNVGLESGIKIQCIEGVGLHEIIGDTTARPTNSEA